MPQKINVVGIPGSLRDDSYNRALLEAARLANEDVK
jgi:NAD(P)H-dependent FMN reductase